ncbi:hypothetical protein F5878DRAFT_328500 [Lentinula raphanica]|uniref:Uncharacterized protein n=1 Tax=Lentinula raphanica TaxID=153919 RepID=A0AA38P2F0_9AGAR|nr:hypothetical protein F5878DRAFT_328500 [Lentinula raphanica]
MYKHTPEIDLLQNQIFAYLRDSNAVNGTNVAFVNLERLFDTIASDPTSFGYRGNATCLISANTIEGGCDDPDHSVFWIRECQLKLAVLCLFGIHSNRSRSPISEFSQIDQ